MTESKKQFNIWAFKSDADYIYKLACDQGRPISYILRDLCSVYQNMERMSNAERTN